MLYETRKQRVSITKALDGIDKVTERLPKAKSLLLDDHIDFYNYEVIKSDSGEKVRLLDKIVTGCSRYISGLSLKNGNLFS